MNPTTTRPVDPIFADFGPSMTDEDLARILQDDGTNGGGAQLATTVTGTPSKTGDWVSRPVNPGNDASPEPTDVDPSSLANPHGDIGLWSGEEGSNNPFFHTHQQIVPTGFGEVDSAPKNGGPDGISEETPKDKFLRESGQGPKPAVVLKNFDKPPPGPIEKFSSDIKSVNEQLKCTKEGGAPMGCSKLGGGGKMEDPEQSQSGEGVDPHAMFNDMVGGGWGIPDGLGIDLKLFDKIFGDKPVGTLVQNTGGTKSHSGSVDGGAIGVDNSSKEVAHAGMNGDAVASSSGYTDKFGELLKQLDGINLKDIDGLSALDTFINAFGIEGLNTVFKEFLPHIDLDMNSHEIAINTYTGYTSGYQDLSPLLATNQVPSDFII